MLFNYIRQVAAAFGGDRQSPYGANFYLLTSVADDLSHLVMSARRRQTHRYKREVRVNNETDSQRIILSWRHVVAAFAHRPWRPAFCVHLHFPRSGALVADASEAAEVL